MHNAISEIARIANDENLPRRRRLGLIKEFLSALGNATGSAVAASAASEPKPTTNQRDTGRDDPAQAGERQNTADGNVIQTNPCIASGRTEGDEKERVKTQASKEAPRRPSHNATSQDARDRRRESLSALMKREHPEEWRALREARNAVARALYDPERERERKARIRAQNPEKWAEGVLRRSRRRKEAKKAWRAAHPEKVREYNRKYAEKRRREGRGTSRIWPSAPHTAARSKAHQRSATTGTSPRGCGTNGNGSARRSRPARRDKAVRRSPANWQSSEGTKYTKGTGHDPPLRQPLLRHRGVLRRRVM